MVTRVSATEAKSGLSGLASRVAYGGSRIIIERRGRAVAALVSMDDLEKLEGTHAKSSQSLGLLALAGAWGDLDDSEIDQIIEAIYAHRVSGVDSSLNISIAERCD